MSKNILDRLDEAANRARQEGHEDYAVLFEDAAHTLRAVVSDSLEMNARWLEAATESNAQIRTHLEELKANAAREKELIEKLEKNRDSRTLSTRGIGGFWR